ncbi:MAG: M23 family metallopeptidase [Bacteroidetes bacterium]|nr:M23 family metallopeptidase [Bacteroidota bacterium]MCH8170427.1 M23 family metallopeptidase [Bacteroidota bacterium]MCH8941327.1 M23 family metallopeptidase [Bacteroidota bacterium]
MNFKKLKELKSFSIIIIPDQSRVQAKQHKFKLGTIISIISFYTFFVLVMGFLVFNVAPLGRMMGINNPTLSKEDIQKVEMLNRRMIFLSRELSKLKSTNQRLKEAIFLGDSTLVDSLLSNKKKKSKDSLFTVKNNQIKGNLYFIINKLLQGKDKKLSEIVFFENPVKGFMSRNFDPNKGHFGIDYVLKRGTPIHASSGGYVIFSDYTVKDGHMLIISNPNNYITIYKHCSILLKRVRETVSTGEIIALSGNSGLITTGPHLHFEIWKEGRPINPKKIFLNYLQE